MWLNQPIWAGMKVSITLSSIVAVAVIGFMLIQALKASGFVSLMESRGLKSYLD